MKKTTKWVSFCLAALLTLTLGSTIVFAAADDATAEAATVQSDGTTKAKPSRQKGSKGEMHVSVLSVAAAVLGKTEEEVKETVKTGKVGDLLVAAGKVEEFKTAYLAQAQEKLNASVTAGTLTQAQADEKYAQAKAKMDAYDGTTHLCGGTDHSKMSEKKDKEAA